MRRFTSGHLRVDALSAWARTARPASRSSARHLPCDPEPAVVRPADAAETATTWKAISSSPTPPPVSVAPNLPNPLVVKAPVWPPPRPARGAYVWPTPGTPDVILMASGSECPSLLRRKPWPLRWLPASCRSPCLDWFKGPGSRIPRRADLCPVGAPRLRRGPAWPCLVPLDRRRWSRSVHRALRCLGSPAIPLQGLWHQRGAGSMCPQSVFSLSESS